MKQLIETIKSAVVEELERAQADHGKRYNSAHEAYAVALEERDEAIREVSEVDKNLEEFWVAIMGDDVCAQDEALVRVENNAIKAACEYIQVAAVAKKALQGYRTGSTHGDD